MHNRQVYSNDANNEGFEHSVVVDTATTVDFGNGMVSSQTFSEVYILTGNITFETYTLLAKALDLSHVRIPRINAIQAAAADTIFARLNVTIQHEFRRKLLHRGNKNLFRAGLYPYEVSITQSAASKLDSRTATTASNSVTLTCRNATGCYSHHLESANSTYTKNVESYTCPRSVFIADFTTSEADKSIWDTIWNSESKNKFDEAHGWSDLRRMLDLHGVARPIAFTAQKRSKLDTSTKIQRSDKPKLQQTPLEPWASKVQPTSRKMVKDSLFDWHHRRLDSSKPKPSAPRAAIPRQILRPEEEDMEDIIRTYTKMILEHTDDDMASLRRTLPHSKKRPPAAQQRVYMPASRIRRTVQSAKSHGVAPSVARVDLQPSSLVRIRLFNTVPSARTINVAPPAIVRPPERVVFISQPTKLPPRSQSATPKRRAQAVSSRPQSAHPTSTSHRPENTVPTVEFAENGKLKLTVHMGHIRMTSNNNESDDPSDDDGP
ncbi:hypothetical protein AeRB84_011761 [Aphanomyces euteiches]|nr:hypothetical protein AeRB84_011761 [Aphanomyces euteiches]